MKLEKNPWEIVDSSTIYDNPWIQLIHYSVINPSGGAGIYGKVHFKNKAIGILAIDQEHNIYLVGQYRFPLEKYSWELPEGGGPLNEPPLEAAKRELLEETGLIAGHWVELLQLDMSNSVTDETAIVFLATELTQHQANPEETEELTVIKQPFSQVYDRVMNGEITDSITVAAILKLRVLGYE